MPLRPILTLALIFAFALAAPAQSHAQSAPTAAHEPAAPLSAAAAQLLHLVDQRVDDGAVELGARLIREHPDDAALHGLYVISLSDYRGLKEAMRLGEEYAERWPDDAWVQVARGYVIRERSRTGDALEAAARARELAPDDPDIARYVMRIHSAHLRHDQAVALADSFIASDRATAGLRAAKASVLWDMADLPGIRDTAAAPLAQRELEIALAETPPTVAAYLLAAERFRRDRRADEALPLLERAVELSPHSNAVRLAYWRGLGARRDITADEKQAEIRAAMDSYLEERQHALAARFAVAEYFLSLRDGEQVDVMAELIQREHAGTWQAAHVAWGRARLEASAAYDRAATQADSAAATRQLREKLWTITTMPGVNDAVLANTYGQLFGILVQDSTTTGDELLSVLESSEEHSAWSSARRYSTLPVALAERGTRLDYAEQLARAGLEPREDNLEGAREWFTVAEYAEFLDWERSGYHSTLGWVLFHKGEIAEAKRELEKAHEALNTASTPLYRLGHIAEAEGDIEAAERWYATGRGREDWDRSSSEALERLYLSRNESLEGFDEYLAAIDERDLARRRAKVESDRIAEPEPLPDFEHDWMNGGRFSSDSLRGKVAVINFWGVWCSPCVREAPDIQAFAETFRDHPDVVFITVSSDNDPDTTRDFMKEKGYDFPVVLDGGLARTLNIFAWPTTLFLDRDGRIVFSYKGASLRLLEEYTWRVDALLGESADGTEAPARAGSAFPLAPAPDAPLSAAAAQLLHLLDQAVYDEAVELGARLLGEHPDDAALHALHAISLREHRRPREALLLIEEYVSRWPDDPWVQVARGYLIGDWTRTDEALAAAARARQLAPESPEIARYVMSIYWAHGASERAVGLADSLVHGSATAGVRVEKASALVMAALPWGRDTAAAALAERELQTALAETPASAAAYLAAGRHLLMVGRPADALAVLERAVELSTHSNAIRQMYWRGIGARTDTTAEAKRAMILSDMDAFLDARQHAVGARRAVADHSRYVGEIERSNLMLDLIQQEHAGTWEAADLAHTRARVEYFTLTKEIRNAAAVQGETSTQADRMAAERRFRDMLRPITTMPGATSDVLAGVYYDLFRSLAQDSTTSADDLVVAFERMEEHDRGPWSRYSRQNQSGARHVTLPIALAERRSRLDQAEQLARDGLQVMEDDLEQWGRVHLTVAEYAEKLDRVKSDQHATLGWVLFHKGDLADAKHELEEAHEILSTAATPPYRLGRIAEAEGDVEEAERWYATGRGREKWDRRSSDALERLYLTRSESLDGFDEYLAAIDERDLARRRAKVESERIAEPEPLPDFEHEWMNGGRFSSESLEGRIAVINFWGVWCVPCVSEAPQIQAFAEKFRDHPDVVFITVANDDDPDTTREFMEEKGYDFPVIFDEGLLRMANIRAWPTTLFVDREGMIVFSYVGETLRVVDEFTWRIEALLGGAVAGTGTETHP